MVSLNALLKWTTRCWSSNTNSMSSSQADYIIDMGPGGGDAGGTVCAGRAGNHRGLYGLAKQHLKPKLT